MSTIRGCVLDKPTKQSVPLGRLHLNLSAIHRATSIDLSYLSKILSGEKECTVSTYKKIAAAIGMGLEELLDAIEERKAQIIEYKTKAVQGYQERVAAEDAQDKKLAKAGKPVPPRLSALRLKSPA